MMANVSGVSQFLETVGVPGSQAAPANAPGQDFAAVMQKAGDDAGSPLPQPCSTLAAGQTEEEAGGTAAVASTQTSTQLAQKAISQAGSTLTAASAPSFRRVYVGGQTPGGGTLGAARSSELTSQMAADTLSSAAAPVVVGSTVAATDLVVTSKAAAPDPDAAGLQVAAATTQENKGADLLAAAPVAASKGAPVNSVQPQPTSAQKPGEVAASAVPPPAKPTTAKVDTKLTALIPQGTADVPQSAAGLPMADSAAPVVLTAPVIGPVADSPRTVEGTARQTATPTISSSQNPVVAAGPAPAAATVQGSTGKQTSNVKGTFGGVPDTHPVATSAVTVASSATPSSQGASFGNSEAPQSAAVMTATASLPAGNAVSQTPQAAPLVAAVSGASAVRNTQTAQAAVQPDASATASPDQANTAVPAALNANGPGQPTAKPGARVSGTLRAAKVVGDPALAVDPASSQAAPAKAAASAAGTGPVPAVAPAQLAAGHAATTTSNVKTEAKQAGVAVSSPMAPVPAPPAGSVKPTVATDSISATSTGKDSSSAAAPLVSSPVVAAPAEMVAVVSTAGAMPPQAPLVHGTAASAPVVSGVAGAGFGAQEVGATASGSLPHTTLSSTPTSLEVGVSSGTHGWLKIRAELNEAGQVDASLTGANAAAATKLRGDLPALNSYLQDEKVQMGSLDVRSALHTAFESGSTFSQAGSGGGSTGSGGSASADASAAGGRGQQAPQQEANAGTVLNGGQVGDEGLVARVSDVVAYGNQTELGGNEGSPLVEYGAGGGWLNVRV